MSSCHRHAEGEIDCVLLSLGMPSRHLSIFVNFDPSRVRLYIKPF